MKAAVLFVKEKNAKGMKNGDNRGHDNEFLQIDECLMHKHTHTQSVAHKNDSTFVSLCAHRTVNN